MNCSNPRSREKFSYRTIGILAILFTGIFCGTAPAAPRKLFILSIDGLDARYLNDASALGLKIPTLRRLAESGAWAEGVRGVVPTVTWPSHTTIITGVLPSQHGIVSNDQPGRPGQRWWFTSFLKSKTLWQAVLEKGGKAATVYWPVTTGANVQANFPEFWVKRSEHEIFFAPIAERATPGLEEKVAAAYPWFSRALWTDRTAMTAVRWIFENDPPDLMLAHIADHDSDAHEFGAYSKPVKSTLEEADQLLAWVLEKMPPDTLVAVVSDHGFENVQEVYRPKVLAAQSSAAEGVKFAGGLFGATTAPAAALFRAEMRKPGSPIAREVPKEELALYPAPDKQSFEGWVAAFETREGVVASPAADGEVLTKSDGKGTHGLWPGRENYRSTFLISGAGVQKKRLGEVNMLQLGPTFAEILGVELPAATSRSLWPVIRSAP